MSLHGSVDLTTNDNVTPTTRTVSLGAVQDNKFSRMFPKLGVKQLTDLEPLDILASRMIENSPEQIDGVTSKDSILPAGDTFLGQFIDHEITSSLRSFDDDEQLSNARTPSLDLDSIYGLGPKLQPYMYDKDRSAFFYLPETSDLPRTGQELAIIADSRNDTNLIISQMHLAFLMAHNTFCNELRQSIIDDEKLFKMARRHMIFYFHHIVYEFLERLLDQRIFKSLMEEGPAYHTVSTTIPLEFMGAAFRYGHSQIRDKYRVNETAGKEFSLFDLAGGRKPNTYVEWCYLYDINPEIEPLRSRSIDVCIPDSMHKMKTDNRSLAALNLRRGNEYGLPSGQAVAAQLITDRHLTEDMMIAVSPEVAEVGLTETPLWYYILQEAQAYHRGNRLGPVGSRIVGEVLVALLNDQRKSLLSDEEILIDIEKGIIPFLVYSGARL